jgi:hypothetical protein
MRALRAISTRATITPTRFWRRRRPLTLYR